MTRARQIGGDDGPPDEGALIMCFRCGEWAVWMPGGRLRKPTFPEYEEIASSLDCQLMRACWVDFHRQQEAKA